jgi:hypothetical protein
MKPLQKFRPIHWTRGAVAGHVDKRDGIPTVKPAHQRNLASA